MDTSNSKWYILGNCFGRQDVDFFSKERYEQKKALKLCADCEVKPQCFETSLALYGENQQGIWGGELPKARQRTFFMRRQQERVRERDRQRRYKNWAKYSPSANPSSAVDNPPSPRN